MDERIVDIVSRAPTVSEVLQENDGELAAPIRFAVRFEAEDNLLLIEVVPEDDTVMVSLSNLVEVGSSFVVASEPSNIMKGQRIESVARMINMQGYIDGIELRGVRSSLGGEAGGFPVFRFEVGASMVFFSYAVFTAPRGTRPIEVAR